MNETNVAIKNIKFFWCFCIKKSFFGCVTQFIIDNIMKIW